MALPYQCLAACTRPTDDGHEWVLYGASGSQLVAQTSAGVRSEWTVESPEVKEPERAEENDGPPGKRVKLTPVKESKPNFAILKTTKDGKFLVAMTAEDKCIRVFQLDAQGRLEQLSQRCMARRPSSITLTGDESTILVADKFGDVYSVPLVHSPEEDLAFAAESKEEKKFAPSATLLTVHSGRNRKTLEEQLKQAEKGPRQVKETPKFKHELLLGHVSMLTDIASATIGSRSYILTADRDEHIRVSRGIPQAHIIEGFCQGHEEFISRLCFTKARHLVSGGGDPYLCVWDWLFYRLVEKIPLRDSLLEHYKSQPELLSLLSGDENFKIAVSGVWSVPNSEPEVDEVLVACEGVPALVSIKLGTPSRETKVLPLAGNLLDLAFVDVYGAGPVVAVSIDHVHRPGSTSEVRSESGASRLQCFSNHKSAGWHEDSSLAKSLQGFSHAGVEDAGRVTADDKALRDVLYGVENLRKRPGAED